MTGLFRANLADPTSTTKISVKKFQEKTGKRRRKENNKQMV
jgi:hypothetical protein